MDPAALVRMQVELEYQLDGSGLLVPFPGSSERARFIVYRYAGSCARFFRQDVPTGVKRRLEELPCKEATHTPESFTRLLGDDPERFVGRSYVFSGEPTLDGQSNVVLRDGRFTIEVNGEPVSWAWSVRENDVSAEVAVETLSAHRRKGHAHRVSAAWARELMSQGKVAFFSHAEDNLASMRLARSLNLTQFAVVAAYA